jgi:hypothetical protein
MCSVGFMMVAIIESSFVKKSPKAMAPPGLVLFLVSLVAISFIANNALGQQNGEPSRSMHMTDHVSDYSRDQQRQRAASENINATNPNNNDLLKVQYVNEINGLPVLVQFTYVGPPKILPIATADSYPEGATINLICTVSGGQRKGLVLSWEKDGRELNDESLRYTNDYSSISIEKTGTDISILRVSNSTHEDSGKYTCKARNPIGEDSTSAQLVINGKHPLIMNWKIHIAWPITINSNSSVHPLLTIIS